MALLNSMIGESIRFVSGAFFFVFWGRFSYKISACDKMNLSEKGSCAGGGEIVIFGGRNIVCAASIFFAVVATIFAYTEHQDAEYYRIEAEKSRDTLHQALSENVSAKAQIELMQKEAEKEAKYQKEIAAKLVREENLHAFIGDGVLEMAVKFGSFGMINIPCQKKEK